MIVKIKHLRNKNIDLAMVDGGFDPFDTLSVYPPQLHCATLPINLSDITQRRLAPLTRGEDKAT